MKFLTYRRGTTVAPGLWLDESRILDIAAALKAAGQPGYDTMLALIAAGDEAVESVRAVAARALGGAFAEAIVPAGEVALLAPIPRPAKNVFCVGRNYKAHVAEGARATGREMKLPEAPQFFSKPPTSVAPPVGDFELDPAVTQKLDYEVELGVVIGKTGRDIPAERALDHVFGYTVVNDLSARDLQLSLEQWFKGKGLDGACPTGPVILHRSAVPDPQRLDLSCTVNGETRQSSNTSLMIFDLGRIIADLSRGMTLEAGDIIATGTPEGVGLGMIPPRFLQPGDVVECRIEGIGSLVTRIVAAKR